MIKSKPILMMVILLFSLFCVCFLCYASDIAINSAEFVAYTDAEGNEDDSYVIMHLDVAAAESVTQLSVCIMGADINNVIQAQATGKIIYVNQFDTPDNGVLTVPLSKSLICSATGTTDPDGAVVYVKIGGLGTDYVCSKAVTVTLPEAEVTYGDVTDDGVVDIGDAIKILRYDAGLETLTEQQLAAAELTGDGVVDIGDAIKILRYDAGLVDSLK